MRSRRVRRVVCAVRTWMARVEVVERWGGRGEGVREGWVEARALRRGGVVKMGSSCWELDERVSLGLGICFRVEYLAWDGVREGFEHTSCRGELRVANVRRDLGAEDSRVFLGFGMVFV